MFEHKPKKNYPKKPQAEMLNLQMLLDEAIKERVVHIEKEFKQGFNMVKKVRKSVTFFGSARTLDDEQDYIVARELAYRISKDLGYAIVTGGGPGIMEAANRGAHEAEGISLGLTINLPMEQVTNPYLTEHMDFRYFFIRKVCLAFSAETYVYFPGGYGTLDEFFEILTLVQTEKIEKIPIILFGKKYWQGVEDLIKKHLQDGDKIDLVDLDLYTITDDIEEALKIIKNAPIRTGIE